MQYYTRREAPPRDYITSECLSLIGIPKAFHNSEISQFEGEEEVKETVKRYIEHIHDMFDDCINLTILGGNGSGKSFVTSIILKHALMHHYSAKRITLKRFIDLTFIPSNDKTEEIKEELRYTANADFLVLDEVGSEPKNNMHLSATFEELMKFREEKGLPTIICTNLDVEEISETYGNTIFSLYEQSCKLKFVNDDARKYYFSKRRGIAILEGREV